MATKKSNDEELLEITTAPGAGDFDHDEDRRRRAREERDFYMAESAKLSRELSEPFPKEIERVLRKSGTELIYIPISEVIVRLNRVFGVTGWSSQIVRCERDPLDPDFIVAHVRLTVDDATNFRQITKDGFGGQKIKRTKQGDIVDLGDEFKGAVSDALKKAAQQFGIGLYLSRSEEALIIEEEHEHAAAMAAIDPTVRALWEQFVGLSKDLDATQKLALNDFWNTYSGGKPKPTLETATPQIVNALIAECTRLMFPGAEYAANDGK